MDKEKRSDRYVAIKGRFKSEQRKVFGIFYFILNREFNSVDTVSVIVSLYTTLYETSLKGSIAEFHNKINSIKAEGQYALSTTQTLQEALKSISTNYNFYQEMEPYIDIKDEKRLSPILQSFFGGVLGDKRIDIQVSIQNVTQEEISLEKFESTSEEETVNDNVSLSDGSNLETTDMSDDHLTDGQVVLEANFLLAPVGGKLVYRLKIGEYVMVKILPNTAVSNQHIDLLKLRDARGHINATPAKILSFKKEENIGCEVIVQISEGVCGKITEEKNVLVKTVQDQASVRSPSTKPAAQLITQQSRKEKNSSMGILIGVIFAFILLILIFILFAAGV